MSRWRYDWLYPLLSGLPTTLPWYVARWFGRDDRGTVCATAAYLTDIFARLFPGFSPTVCEAWAWRHLDMLACEMVDALAFHRLGRPGGPRVTVEGLDHARELLRQGRGVILVLNHWDRLLTAPVMLARAGVRVNVLTMPVLNNPALPPYVKRFLMRKIQRFVAETGGQWRSTDQGLRLIHDDLRRGGVWLILADAWRPEFSRMRLHPFLGGMLRLPTGIERLASATQAGLLQAWTDTHEPARLSVTFRPLPQDAVAAIDEVVRHLEQQVISRPWAWWQWGLWDSMWTPAEERG